MASVIGIKSLGGLNGINVIQMNLEICKSINPYKNVIKIEGFCNALIIIRDAMNQVIRKIGMETS